MIKIIVSGIPRGYHDPRPDGNWLKEKHRKQLLSLSKDIELVEIPAHQLGEADLSGMEIAVVEGGNRIHYKGELDWVDYERLFVPSLKWIQLGCTGINNQVTEQILDGSVALCNVPGLHTVALAESVMAAMLEHAKNFKVRRSDQEKRLWRELKNDELGGRTILLIGLGGIGKKLASFCRPFGMRIIGTKRRVEPVENVDLVFPREDLAKHLPEADYVVMACPLTPETDNMIGYEEFAAMKETAHFSNVGRGKTVNQEALVDALANNRIGGAFLDAHSPEPLPNDHPLWALPNAFIIPHDSHSSPYIGDRVTNVFCKNLERYLRGEPLFSACDPRQGY